jgi:hypothetical protein
MVRGLALFKDWFQGFEDQYVLIGGTAAKITMTEQGLDFRGTKDLDIVLHVEVLTAAFGVQFWEFVEAGGYQRKEGNLEQRPCLYRFQKPLDDEFPLMLELFSRVPDSIHFVPPGHLTPIPMDEQVSSLSAILLNDDYYQFVLAGRRHKNGLPSWVGEDRLIPLKAVAWLELTERSHKGEAIDSKNIRKHLSDIVTLSALLTPAQRIDVPPTIRADMQTFLVQVAMLGQAEYALAMGRIAEAYGVAG